MVFKVSAPFHAGELSVQHRAGTRGVADELASGISTSLHLGIGDFFSELRLVWIASLSTPSKHQTSQPSNVWVSPLFGKPGFLRTKNHASIIIESLLHAVPTGDILFSNLQQPHPHPVGLLALDFANRRRYRVNGSVPATTSGDAQCEIQVKEAFPNCPKYIQKRILDPTTETSNPIPVLSHQVNPSSQIAFEEDEALSERDVTLISSSESFFLGTYHDSTSLDANHRGGQPGFVRVRSKNELYWPDYRGNGMFQSLGNIHCNDRAGITFLNYATGELLQLTGRAEIMWEARKMLRIEAAAERAVRFFVERVRRSVGPVTNYRWRTVENSPYNPVLIERLSGGAATDSNDGKYRMEVRLVKIVSESRNVKTFRFLAPERIRFLPGQYATFEFSRIDGINTSGGVINRTWTLSESANSTDGDVSLEISVKRKNEGLMSTWLHDQAQKGASVKLLGIGGEMSPFLHGNRANKLLLISGGIGITPNMSILRGIGAFKHTADVVFIHQEREIEDMPFQNELMRRAHDSGGRTRVRILVSSMGERVNKDVLLSMMRDLSDRDIYLCGPRGFMESVTQSLLQAGALRHRIKTEDFSF